MYDYNYYVYTIGLFLGLQFTHTDIPALQGFCLSWPIMMKWPAYMWIFFLCLMAVLAAILCYIFFLYIQIGMALHYLLIAAVLLVVF